MSRQPNIDEMDRSPITPKPEHQSKTDFAYIIIPDLDGSRTPSLSPSPPPSNDPPDITSHSGALLNEQPLWDMIPSCAPFAEYIFDGFTRLEVYQQKQLLQWINTVKNDGELRCSTGEKRTARTLGRDGTYRFEQRQNTGPIGSGAEFPGQNGHNFDLWDRMWCDLVDRNWGRDIRSGQPWRTLS